MFFTCPRRVAFRSEFPPVERFFFSSVFLGVFSFHCFEGRKTPQRRRVQSKLNSYCCRKKSDDSKVLSATACQSKTITRVCATHHCGSMHQQTVRDSSRPLYWGGRVTYVFCLKPKFLYSAHLMMNFFFGFISSHVCS